MSEGLPAMAGAAGIVVTGTGAVSSAGATVEALWAAMCAGEAAPVRVSDPWAHMPRPMIYAVDDDDIDTAAAPAGAGRTTQLAMQAAHEALRGAERVSAVPRRRLGVVVGTGMGHSGEHEVRRAIGAIGDTGDTGDTGATGDTASIGEARGGNDVATAPAPGQRAVFAVAGDIARAVGARGPALSVSNACAASAYAVGEAVQLLDSGECDVVLAVGAESYSRVALGCFNRMGAVDAEACRPFSAQRDGTLFGEGAAVLVLERADDAAARGAEPLARLLGMHFSCDADHPTAPSAEGEQAERALRSALDASGVSSAAVVAVVPHGTGTQQNDVVESAVLGRVFGQRLPQLPVYSLKALLGHTGGAAGALAAVAAVEVARRRVVPRNVDVGAQDPDCAVSLDRHHDVATGPGPVLVNAYAFGGNNASLVFDSAR